MQDLLSKFQDRCVVLSSMQSVQRCLSVAADVAPVHQVRSEIHQPAQYPCVGRDSGPDAMLQRSLQCSSLSHCTFDDPVGLVFTQLVVSPEPGFPLGDLVRVPSPVPQSPVHCRI